jgi:ADP-L-glycero-D-manno-heptose 6-epimerase
MKKNNTTPTILLTGAAGFIGSCMLEWFNKKEWSNLYICDDFSVEKKLTNWNQKKFVQRVERENLFSWLETAQPPIDIVIHLGARTDTTEFDYSIHQHLNVDFSQKIWLYCSMRNIPLIYASSAATYGNGDMGYIDSHELAYRLTPLNPYGRSKNEFDKWALNQSLKPSAWAGLKFFNVYGPNEYHKGRMASVVFHAYNQIVQNGQVKLFRSHRAEIKDGEQLRDFVYVKDVLSVIGWMMENMLNSSWPSGNNGLYNLGTGLARSFFDLAKNTFLGAGFTENIEFINMPEDIRDSYQYFTEANIEKLRSIGYLAPFHSLEEGIIDYVKYYLVPGYFY